MVPYSLADTKQYDPGSLYCELCTYWGLKVVNVDKVFKKNYTLCGKQSVVI